MTHDNLLKCRKQTQTLNPADEDAIESTASFVQNKAESNFEFHADSWSCAQYLARPMKAQGPDHMTALQEGFNYRAYGSLTS
jgi:hypothetical protein